MVRTGNKAAANGVSRTTRNAGESEVASDENTGVERRVLRSKYLRFKSRLCDERDDLSKVDSDKFKLMIDEVDNLHQLVQKPREQVADAEALFDITNTLLSSVKAYSNEGLTPADFVSCLLRDFAPQGGASSSSGNGARNMLSWKDLGQVVSHVFRSAPGCCTMVGPMSTEIKQRKNAVGNRKRTRPTTNVRPEELDEAAKNEKTDTDKNMAVMFDILRKNRKVNLENLILNRNSFPQTVENLFALSFLVKDGRAEITVDESGSHRVSPKNAPSANAILSGESSYGHFIFRFDYGDWKLMVDSVTAGEELMPHRIEANEAQNNTSEPEEEQTTLPTTPIRKLSRNRGLVTQEQSLVEDSPSPDGVASRDAAIRKGKRKLR